MSFNRRRKMRKESHELQWLETVSQRKQLTEEQRRALQRLQKGLLGEQQMDQLAEMFLSGKVLVIDDITLRYQNTVVQIDKLLIIGNTIYVIDVKFYQGNYILQNNSWIFGGKFLTTNILEQLRKAMRVIVNIFREQQIDLEVKGVLAFLNPKSSIQIKDQIPETVLSFNEIPAWLLGLNQQTANEYYYDCQSVLFQYRIDNYRSQRTLSIEEEKQLQKGIRCSRCHQLKVVDKRHTVRCDCGYVEPKETAYTRTICEFGVIFHDQDLKLKKLKEFFGEQVDEHYLKYILKRHFVSIKSTPKKKFGHQNKGIIFDYWFEDKIRYFKKLEKRIDWSTPILKN